MATLKHPGKGRTVVVPDGTVGYYTEHGWEVVDGTPVPESTPQGPESEGPSKSWKVDQLKAYAEEHGIDLGGATKKDDLLSAIEAAAAASAEDEDGDDEESGEPSGSGDSE